MEFLGLERIDFVIISSIMSWLVSYLVDVDCLFSVVQI